VVVRALGVERVSVRVLAGAVWLRGWRGSLEGVLCFCLSVGALPWFERFSGAGSAI